MTQYKELKMEKDISELKKDYGNKITFHGNISTHKTLPFGTIEDVEKEVIDLIKVFGQGGGLILCTDQLIQHDVPIKNIQTLYNTAYKYRNLKRV